MFSLYVSRATSNSLLQSAFTEYNLAVFAACPLLERLRLDSSFRVSQASMIVVEHWLTSNDVFDLLQFRIR